MGLNFTGTRIVSLGSPAALDNLHNSSGMSFAGWILPTAASAGGELICKGNSYGATGEYGFYISSLKLGFFLKNSVGDYISVDCNTALSTSTPSHVAVTWNRGITASSDVIIYINGSPDTHASDDDLLVASYADDSAENISLGNEGGGSDGYDGVMYDFAAWAGVLTAAQVGLLATSKQKYFPLQVSAANLKGYWPLDEFTNGTAASGSGTIIDRSGNGCHGTASNSPTGADDSFMSYFGDADFIDAISAAAGATFPGYIGGGYF